LSLTNFVADFSWVYQNTPKDIVKRLCVRTLNDFHAERSLLSTASQLLSGYAAASTFMAAK